MTLTRQVKSLPELLLEQGIASPEQLQAAQAQAATLKVPLKRVVTQQGLITEQDLTNLLATQFGMTVIDLSSYLIKPEIIQLVPEPLARKHTLIPIFKIGTSVTIAVSDPLNFFALDEVRLKTKCEVKTVLASETAIRHAIDQYYGASGTIQEVAKAVEAAQVPQQEEDAAGEAVVLCPPDFVYRGRDVVQHDLRDAGAAARRSVAEVGEPAVVRAQAGGPAFEVTGSGGRHLHLQ